MTFHDDSDGFHPKPARDKRFLQSLDKLLTLALWTGALGGVIVVLEYIFVNRS